jgi:RNA polymerase sigma-70 factor (ECF subfamily)
MLEREEFAAWYREQHPRVLAALTIVAGSTDVAADATAEAFVRAYERWDRVRTMGSPGGWLYRVALNVVRRRARRHSLEHDLLRRVMRTAAPAPPAAPSALQPEVWEAVRALPDRQRTAVALRYVLDLPEAEVAALMGITRGAASSYLTTARRTLAVELAADGARIEETHHG